MSAIIRLAVFSNAQGISAWISAQKPGGKEFQAELAGENQMFAIAFVNATRMFQENTGNHRRRSFLFAVSCSDYPGLKLILSSIIEGICLILGYFLIMYNKHEQY